jgi:hypothetical protein
VNPPLNGFVYAAPAPATARQSQPKGWIATFVALVLMVLIVGAGFYAQGAVASIPPQPVTVADGVVLTPVADWEFAGRSDDGTTVLLTQGVGSLAISALQGEDARYALEAKRHEWIATGTVRVGGIERVENINSGRGGLRFSYSGTFDGVAAPVEGAVTAVAGTSVSVLFDGWAGIGEYRSVTADIDSMISSAVIP